MPSSSWTSIGSCFVEKKEINNVLSGIYSSHPISKVGLTHSQFAAATMMSRLGSNTWVGVRNALSVMMHSISLIESKNFSHVLLVVKQASYSPPVAATSTALFTRIIMEASNHHLFLCWNLLLHHLLSLLLPLLVQHMCHHCLLWQKWHWHLHFKPWFIFPLLIDQTSVNIPIMFVCIYKLLIQPWCCFGVQNQGTLIQRGNESCDILNIFEM